jgi:hypothetical protein
MTHPADDPNFCKNASVWYLAHPLAPDDKFTYEQNMEHILHMLRICYEEGVYAIAPYHTMCLVLKNSEYKDVLFGLECDIGVVKALGRTILCGHKISKGMALELSHSRVSMDLTGLTDAAVRSQLRRIES